MNAKLPTLEEAVIARFNEIGVPQLMGNPSFEACVRAMLNLEWVFIWDRRGAVPKFFALPPKTPSSHYL